MKGEKGKRRDNREKGEEGGEEVIEQEGKRGQWARGT